MISLVQKFVSQLEELADPSYLPFLELMIPSNQRKLGLKTPVLRKVLKQLILETQDFCSHEKINLAIELINTNIFEASQMAYEFVGKNNSLVSALTPANLIEMNRNLDNWATVDIFGVYVHGKAWRMGIITDDKIIALAKHPDFWQRRLALVSTIPLNQKANGGSGDHIRTLLICDILLNDYHDLVVKALSWALRELSKREPEIVSVYIEKYKNVLHKRVVREVSNKLIYGTKNLF